MKRTIAALSLLTLTMASSRASEACAPAPLAGESVRIAMEEALIAYDPSAQLEHFVRRARFQSSGSEFGFLVPTPTVPTLGEVSDSLFTQLAQASEPRYEYVHRRHFSPGLSCTSLLMKSSRGAHLGEPPEQSAAPAVRVLSSQRVAGFDAVVLAATDADALTRWLTEHHYATRPALTEWLRTYVSRAWTITAFRIAKREDGRADPAVQTSAVRMTFRTPQAFYPYREPADQRALSQPGRTLRLFVASTERLAGTHGEGAEAWGTPTEYAAPNAAFLATLRGMLPDMPSASLQWLQRFEDTTEHRPDADLYFRRDPSQTPVIPVRRIEVVDEVPVLLDCIAVPLVVIAFTVRAVRRRRRAKVQ